MKKIYWYIERGFEKVTAATMDILGNSLTFLVAVGLVIYWLTDKQYAAQTLHQKIENIIMSVTFLTLFIIQKEFKRFAAALHIKLNELVSSNEAASNQILNVEQKTEYELQELTKQYADKAATDRQGEKTA